MAATRDLVAQKLTKTRFERKKAWNSAERGEQRPDQGEEENSGDEAEGEKVRKYQLYVDGIHGPMSNAELATVFAPYGRVGRLAILAGRFFTFVDLETTRARALAACLEVTGRDFFGNVLRVQFSKRPGQERISQQLRSMAAELPVPTGLVGGAGGEGMATAAEEFAYFSRRDPMEVGQQQYGGGLALTSSSGQLNDDKILPR